MLFKLKLGKLKSEKYEEKFGFKRERTMRYSTQIMQKELGLGNSCWGSTVLMYRPTCDKQDDNHLYHSYLHTRYSESFPIAATTTLNTNTSRKSSSGPRLTRFHTPYTL